MQALESAGSSTNSARAAVVSADIAELRKDYPDDPHVAVMQFDLAQVLKLRDPGAAESMLRELDGSQNIQVAAMAQQQLDSMKDLANSARSRLDLKFKAVDGTDIDLAKLRGQGRAGGFLGDVVRPVPHGDCPTWSPRTTSFTRTALRSSASRSIRARRQLLKFTKQAGMTWPQYFDGKGWANDISTRYGINSIPAAWLVDKKGFVRTTEARGADLAEQVKALLAE